MQIVQKVPKGCTHPSVSNDYLQLAGALEHSGPFILLYFFHFSMESKHMNYLKIREVWHLGFPWGPQWLEGQAGTPRPLPTFCPPVWGMAAPSRRKSTEPTPDCVSPVPSQESCILAHLELSINQAPGSSSEAEQMFRGGKEKPAQQLREDNSC